MAQDIAEIRGAIANIQQTQQQQAVTQQQQAVTLAAIQQTQQQQTVTLAAVQQTQQQQAVTQQQQTVTQQQQAVTLAAIQEILAALQQTQQLHATALQTLQQTVMVNHTWAVSRQRQAEIRRCNGKLRDKNDIVEWLPNDEGLAMNIDNMTINDLSRVHRDTLVNIEAHYGLAPPVGMNMVGRVTRLFNFLGVSFNE